MANPRVSESKRRKFYKPRPLLWMHDVLGVDPESIKWHTHEEYENHDWDGDVDPLHQVAWHVSQGTRRIGLHSGVGTGKTYLLAGLSLWFLDIFVPSRIITMAPKAEQLDINLWAEISDFWDDFQELHPQAELQSRKIVMNYDDKASKLQWGARGYAAGADAGEKLAQRAKGFHDKHMMVIFEEMPGVHPAVIKSFIRTAVAPHNIIVGVGNPVSDQDNLAQFCKRESTKSIRVSALDHPNVVKDDGTYIDGAVTKESTREVLIEDCAGDDSDPEYKGQVRGMFPVASSHSLFRNCLEQTKKELTEPYKIVDHQDYDNGIEGKTYYYREPEETHLNRYLTFMDVAGEKLDGDAHCAIMFDRVEREPVALVHMRGLGEPYIDAVLDVCQEYKIDRMDHTKAHPLVCWETNGVGAHFHNLSDRLEKYPNLYYERNIESARSRPRMKYGWNTGGSGSNSREKMIYELKNFAQELQYFPERMVSEVLWREAKTFARNESGKWEGAGGNHDDAVMSLAGCLIIDRVEPDPLAFSDHKSQKEEKQKSQMPRRSRKNIYKGGHDRARDGKKNNSRFNVDTSDFSFA